MPEDEEMSCNELRPSLVIVVCIRADIKGKNEFALGVTQVRPRCFKGNWDRDVEQQPDNISVSHAELETASQIRCQGETEK